ncbi:MAG: hypothetical protein E7259_01130 [Lachnospiraceae bacterium]|nr:hypothetical protein [Lachnospiraceae bacterium]
MKGIANYKKCTKKIVCIGLLIVVMLCTLVGCGKNNYDDFNHEWEFVKITYGTQVYGASPLTESVDPKIEFDGTDVVFWFNGKSHEGKLEYKDDEYIVTFEDGWASLTAEIEDDGDTLMINISKANADCEFRKK